MDNFNLNNSGEYITGETVPGSYTLSCDVTRDGLWFFGDVKTLVALAAPVSLFPQPMFTERSYKREEECETRR
jgi:hypothetical protein